MKNQIKSILRKVGYDINQFPPQDIRRRIQLFNYFNINKIFDVGANTGGYASSMRSAGYVDNIISFEPVKVAYNQLVERSIHDKKWSTKNIALGNSDGSAIINVSQNLVSSSISEMSTLHVNSAPDSLYLRKEEIEIHRLDTIFFDLADKQDKIMLKIDTQGFEKNVIDGAEKSLPLISGLQLEMSLVPLYNNELLFPELLQYVNDKGFSLYSLENGFSDPDSGQLLQVDGIFFRKDLGL
jgi:FkbM family methyltransferase